MGKQSKNSGNPRDLMPFKDCLDFSISLYITVEFPVCKNRPDILTAISQFLEINVISKTHPPLVK
jgi:hypothetical protein